VWLPPWTEHGIDNTGNETMEILVMSGPPNP
jgi:mannose-6-phosphate isomerase-like protein (cupin superfamily)